MPDHFNIDFLFKCIGCLIKLINNMATYGFCPIISVEIIERTTLHCTYEFLLGLHAL